MRRKERLAGVIAFYVISKRLTSRLTVTMADDVVGGG